MKGQNFKPGYQGKDEMRDFAEKLTKGYKAGGEIKTMPMDKARPMAKGGVAKMRHKEMTKSGKPMAPKGKK